MKFAEKLVFVYIFILGIAFTFLVPPLQKPDEHGHFKRAILLSKGYVLLVNDGKKLPIEKMYANIINDKLLNSIPYHPEIKFDINWYRKPLFATVKDYQVDYVNPKGMFILPAIPYFPHAIGLFMGRLMNLNGVVGFFLGRFCMFILSFIVMIWIYKKTTKPYNYFLLFMFSLPMLIHQITGYSYDGMHYLLAAATFSTFVNLISTHRKKIKHTILFSVCLLLFLMNKPIFEPFFFLILLIPIQKKIWLLFGLIVSYVIIKLPFFISSYNYHENPAGVVPIKQIAFILQNPFRYLYIFITSGVINLKFHVQGVIGIFGWLDYSMHPILYFIWILVAIYLIVYIHPSKKIIQTKKRALFIVMIPFITYCLIQTFFYITWKPVGAPVIDGTQGRYYASFMPFILLGLIFLKPKVKKVKISERYLNFLFVTALFLIIVSVVNTIQARYF